MLRVLNDDTIAAGMGLEHPHDNMEIITIPLEGDLAHKDSMGNGTTIKSRRHSSNECWNGNSTQ